VQIFDGGAQKIRNLTVRGKLMGVKYICNVMPYYSQLACFYDNDIEIKDKYTPEQNEFDD